MRLARIKGVDIVVSPVLIVLAMAAAFSGFPIRVLILAVAVLFHEAAHWVTAAFGVPAGGNPSVPPWGKRKDSRHVRA